MRRTTTLDGTGYAPGRRFRVIREGLILSGMVPAAPSAWDGWSQRLHPGDIVTCTGYGPGFGGDPGYGVEFTTPESLQARAGNCTISPSTGGAFGCRPVPGALEPAGEPD